MYVLNPEFVINRGSLSILSGLYVKHRKFHAVEVPSDWTISWLHSHAFRVKYDCGTLKGVLLLVMGV